MAIAIYYAGGNSAPKDMRCSCAKVRDHAGRGDQGRIGKAMDIQHRGKLSLSGDFSAGNRLDGCDDCARAFQRGYGCLGYPEPDSRLLWTNAAVLGRCTRTPRNADDIHSTSFSTQNAAMISNFARYANGVARLV